MDKLEKLVKVVSAQNGSKRITIPKEISEKMNLKNEDYVIVRYENDRRLIVAPAEITMRK